jgi:hypothetical protein
MAFGNFGVVVDDENGDAEGVELLDLLTKRLERPLRHDNQVGAE